MPKQFHFSGRWRCQFWYPSNHHEGTDVAEYEVEVFQRGNKLTMDSLPKANNAHMTVNLTVDGRLATGAWLENTSPQSEFEGLVYSGALQLLINEDGSEMKGKWVGIGREKTGEGTYEAQIYSGDWKITRLSADEQEVGREVAGADAAEDPAPLTGTTES
jgi:hypothetical protein